MYVGSQLYSQAFAAWRQRAWVTQLINLVPVPRQIIYCLRCYWCTFFCSFRLIRTCSDRINTRVNFLLIKKYFTLAGLSKLNSMMVSTSILFEVKTWRRPARPEPCCQISTFQVFRGLQVHHSTLESIGMSSRKKICGIWLADFLRNDIFTRQAGAVRGDELVMVGWWVFRCSLKWPR